jgi:flagellar basal-body rod protein FlgB
MADVTPISEALLLKAMDCLMVRSTVIAENIANAGTKGYRPLAVSFESALAKAAATRDGAAVASVTPQVVHQVDASGRSELRLDLELANASQTATRFSALAELLNRRLQIEALVASGSR